MKKKKLNSHLSRCAFLSPQRHSNFFFPLQGFYLSSPANKNSHTSNTFDPPWALTQVLCHSAGSGSYSVDCPLFSSSPASQMDHQRNFTILHVFPTAFRVKFKCKTQHHLRLTVESDSPLPSAHQWTHSDHWLRALSSVPEPLSQGYHCMKLLSPPCSLKHCLLLVIFLTILLPSFPFLADWGVHLCLLHYSIIIMHFLPWLCF